MNGTYRDRHWVHHCWLSVEWQDSLFPIKSDAQITVRQAQLLCTYI